MFVTNSKTKLKLLESSMNSKMIKLRITNCVCITKTCLDNETKTPERAVNQASATLTQSIWNKTKQIIFVHTTV